jgi:UDP-N-acetyl-D-mannosaminuronic acid transferase (WecB/TagA/CpsF family)
LEGVAKMAAEKLKEKYPGLKVVGTCSPSIGFEKDSAEINRIIDMYKAPLRIFWQLSGLSKAGKVYL